MSTQKGLRSQKKKAGALVVLLLAINGATVIRPGICRERSSRLGTWTVRVQ